MKWLLAFFISFSTAFAASSFEIEGISEKHHGTADRTLYHSKEKVYEAFGHVVISSQGKRLSADYIWIDTNTKELRAKGNVIFVDKRSVTQAAEIHYNLDTSFGSIFYGKVSNDFYTLKGQLIRKVDESRFLTTEGEYTTCKDCAESWKLSAKNVDFTVDGYAYMDSVYLKIKDVPTIYVPYMILPVKTKRQTGLLFPKIGLGSQHGFSYMQPFFLVIDDHQDITLTGGKFSEIGSRYESEYRYKFYDGVEGSVNYYHVNDRKFTEGKLRQAFKTKHEWSLGNHYQMRWKILEVSDRDYPTDFPSDIPGVNLSELESNAVATASYSDFFISAEAKRYRNLLYDKLKGFDGGTVQAMPSVYFGVKERPVIGPFMANISGRFDHFRRHNGSIYEEKPNFKYDPFEDNLREADRMILTPEISAPFRIGRFLNLSPSIQYNEGQYSFPLPNGNSKYESASQRWLVGKIETSSIIERVFDYNGKKVNRVKHQLTPFITYSNVPWFSRSDEHPFFKSQIAKQGGLFDQNDIVPLTNSTNFMRLPQGNSLYYGFTSRVIRKFRSASETPKSYPYDRMQPKPKKYPVPYNLKQKLSIANTMLWDQYNPHYEEYQEIWNLSVSQAYDMIDAKKHRDDKTRAFSYLYAKSNFNIDNFSNSIEYKYFPSLVEKILDTDGVTPKDKVHHDKHYFTTNATLYLSRFENLQKTKSFVRSISADFTNSSKPNLSRTAGLAINWSFTDFLAVQGKISYNLLTKKENLHEIKSTLTHPSECWQLGIHYSRDASSGTNAEYGVDLGINLTGTGFIGVNQDSASSGGGIFGGSN